MGEEQVRGPFLANLERLYLRYIYIYTVRLILRVFLARINYILEHKLARRKEGEASSNYAFRERAETDTFRSREKSKIDRPKKEEKKERRRGERGGTRSCHFQEEIRTMIG